MLSDKLMKMADFIKSTMAGKHYKKFGNEPNSIYCTFATRSSGANLILAGVNNKYYVLALKKNKMHHTTNIEIHFLENNRDPLKTMKSLYQAANAGRIVKYFKENLSKEKFMDLVLIKEALNPYLFEQWFPEIPLESQQEERKIGNFIFVYESTIKDSEKENLIGLVNEVSKAVKSIGLSKLLYGKVVVVPSLGGRAIADYTVVNDVIRLSKKAKKNNKDVFSFLHELAHRLQDKGWADDRKISEKYYEKVLTDIKVDKTIQVGDVFVDNNGRKIEIKDKKFKRDLYYVFEIEGKSGLWRAPAAHFYNLEKIKGQKSEPKIWVPTSYSTKNEKEWFSEIFATALIKNIKELKDFVKEVAK